MFKWLFGIVGYLFFGSFFAAFGCYIVGSLIDSAIDGRVKVHKKKSTRRDFIHDLLIFTAAVMKSDGHLYKKELNYVKNFLLQNLDADDASDALHELKNILEQEYDLQRVCYSFKMKTTSSEKLLMLRFLFGLANSDGAITSEELNTIRYISDNCGIPYMHFESVKAMYVGGYAGSYGYEGDYSRQRSYSRGASSSNDLENDYKILEISSSASDEEVKKAYRRLAKEHHPDKVAHLGEEMRKAAEEKFTKLNQAYERIKEARGMK